MKNIRNRHTATAECFLKLGAILALSAAGLQAESTISAQVNEKGARISPTQYGIFYEEIERAGDGGLYAEMIQNRVFKADAKRPVHWSLAQENGAMARIALDNTNPLNERIPTCLRLEVAKASIVILEIQTK